MQAAVALAYRTSDKQFFAIKCTNRDFIKTDNEALNKKRWTCMRMELQIMEELNNKHVIKYIEFLSEDDYFY